MPRPMRDDTMAWVYAIEWDNPDSGHVGCVYVGITYGEKGRRNPGLRLQEHLERKTPESRKYLPSTNEPIVFAGLLFCYTLGEYPHWEASILRSYEAAGWHAPQRNKNCGWPIELTDEDRAECYRDAKLKRLARRLARTDDRHHPDDTPATGRRWAKGKALTPEQRAGRMKRAAIGTRDMGELPALMSTARAAAALSVSVRRVRQMLERGKLVGANYGHQWLITRDSLESYVCELRGYT
jgi:excisionase family DNA binding protein